MRPAFTGWIWRQGKSTLIRQSKVAADLSQYETKQVFYSSKDGTRVPMFLSYKKGLKLDGQNPTLLYAYGGFDIAETPQFRPWIVEWMQMGGVYAVANIRGGSEYGEAWHQAGMRAKKQNVFDDFIAAAEWLIANKYTSTPKLAIYGGEQRRIADRRGAESAARFVWRGDAGGGRNGHAAIPEFRVRNAVGGRVRIVGRIPRISKCCARIRRCTIFARARSIRRR